MAAPAACSHRCRTIQIRQLCFLLVLVAAGVNGSNVTTDVGTVWKKWLTVLVSNSSTDYLETLNLLTDTTRLLYSPLWQVHELRLPGVVTLLNAAKTLESSETRDTAALIKALSNVSVLLDEYKYKMSAYPVTRRVVLGSLLKKQLELNSWTGDVQKLVLDICVKLFKLHKQGASEKGAIEFFHISKSGGTSFCSLAKKNKCKTDNFGQKQNCLILEFDDGPRWVSVKAHKLYQPKSVSTPWFVAYEDARSGLACAFRKKFMNKHKYNFYANEYVLHGGQSRGEKVHLCGEFFNVLLFRQPQQRLVSHLKWIIRLYREHYGKEYTRFFKFNTANFWEKLAPAAMNNYYIRSLLGEKVFHLLPNKVTPEHLEMARYIVLQFDILLTLEETEVNSVTFNTGMGWSETLEEVKARSGDKYTAMVKDHEMPGDIGTLMERNYLDIDLYYYTQLLQKLDAFMFDVIRVAAGQDQQVHQLLQNGKSCGYVSI